MDKDKKDPKKKDKEAGSDIKTKEFKEILNAKFENVIKMQHDDAGRARRDSAVAAAPVKKDKRDKDKEKEKEEKEKEQRKKEKEKEREEREKEKESKKKEKEKEKKEKRDKDGKEKDKEKDKDKDRPSERDGGKDPKDLLLLVKDDGGGGGGSNNARDLRLNAEPKLLDKRGSGVRPQGKIFGGNLKDGLYDRKGGKHAIPPFFEQVLVYLEERALETTGLFQEAGPKKEIKELIKRIEAKQDIEWAKIKNPHTVAGLLLKYLRDLEEPIFPYYLYSHLIETVSKGEAGLQVNESALRQLLHALPAPNIAFLKRFLPFLRQVAAHSSKNQLVAESLATFFGPLLLRPEGEMSLQALVSHASEVLFLMTYMINFTPTDLLFSFPEEGSNQRRSNCGAGSPYGEPGVDPSSVAAAAAENNAVRHRTSTEPGTVSAVVAGEGEEEAPVPLRRGGSYIPQHRPSPALRVSTTAAGAAFSDGAPAYIDDFVGADNVQAYGRPHEPSGSSYQQQQPYPHGSPIDRGHMREPSGAPWVGDTTPGGDFEDLNHSFDGCAGNGAAYQESAGSSMAWFVWLVRSLPPQTYHQARTWPDYDESADIYLVNENELYVYPEQSEFFAVFTSELYRVEDSSRYYYIVSEEGDKLGLIFSTREESAAFAKAIQSGLGYAIPVGDNAAGRIGGGTDPKWKSQKKDKFKSIAMPDRGDTLSKEFEEREVMHDGWFDAPAALSDGSLSLDQLRALPVNMEAREVIEVDARTDARLQNILRLTQLLFSKFPTLETKVRVIALQVANALGGVCSEDLREIHATHIQNVKNRLQSNVIPIGSIKFGVLRHRVILFKYLCDHLHPAIPCTLSMNEEGMLCNLVPVSSNITRYKGVDLMTVPGRLRAEGRDRKIMWRGSPGSAVAAERHVILPDLQSEPIVFHKKLGEGGFSTVYRCAIGPLTCAAKVYKRTDDRIGKDLVRECMIQTHLSHKNILRCLGYEKTATDFRIFFEYMGLGSFWDVLYRRQVALKPFEPKEIAYYASEVARGLHYLHRNKIFHRDIKSANILVDGDEGEFFKSVKLCDFNISTYRADAFSRVGTPQYMAPELLNNTDGRPIDTEKADMWSFGMFIVELITLDAPYAGLAENEYVRLISRGILPPNLPSVKENKGVELVMKCCNINPALRPSARDVVLYLNPLDDSCNA